MRAYSLIRVGALRERAGHPIQHVDAAERREDERAAVRGAQAAVPQVVRDVE